MTELLVDRLLRERALRSEVGHLQGLLLREAGGHDLAEQSQDLLVAQRSALLTVAVEREPQHLRLALRAIEIHGMAGGVLGDAHLLREPRPLVDERMEFGIHRVDARADALERRFRQHRGARGRPRGTRLSRPARLPGRPLARHAQSVRAASTPGIARKRPSTSVGTGASVSISV